MKAVVSLTAIHPTASFRIPFPYRKHFRTGTIVENAWICVHLLHAKVKDMLIIIQKTEVGAMHVPVGIVKAAFVIGVDSGIRQFEFY